MNGRVASYRSRTCKVMQFNTTGYFVTRKIKKKCFSESFMVFVNLTYVSTRDKICFSEAEYIYIWILYFPLQ
jgi:hypothetical protein